MARKQGNVAKDPYEEEYGPTQIIYINESAQKRLNGDESYGNWYQTCRYSNSPTAEFCVKTVVPESALEDGVFHPDRFEPNIVAERCEKVSPKEITHSTKNNKPEPRFKKGDKVAIAVHGAGVTSYEPHIVEAIRRGVVYLENNDDFVEEQSVSRVHSDFGSKLYQKKKFLSMNGKDVAKISALNHNSRNHTKRCDNIKSAF